MLDSLLRYFETNSFLAHGYCLTWRTDLIALHAISDFLIAASYFVIPTAIMYLNFQRPDLIQDRIAYLFSAFIIACGLTHLVGLVTLWEPVYGFEGILKAGTAMVSGMTALASWMLMPSALKIPSAATLKDKNIALEQSFEEQRKAYAELELVKAELDERVRQRTRELHEKAEALERVNASLSQYAHFASHDLQEPLRKIVSFSELAIEEEATDGDDLKLYLETIRTSAVRARNLVRTILHHAEVEHHQPEMEPLSLRRETEQALENHALAIAEREGEVSLEIADVTVLADTTLFSRIVENLVGNAVKFTPADRQPRIVITARRTPGGMNYVVTDNGRGFNPEYKDRIFEPFRRLSAGSQTAGNGMGLAIVATAIHQLGWTISVDTEEMQGTSFRISIPSHHLVEEGGSGYEKHPAD
jgi:signal transduction histidine kinase